MYESLGCGTPVIVARISSHREILPEHLVDKVNFGDNTTVAKLAADIIQQKRRVSAETLAYLHEHYAIELQLEQYAAAILAAKCADELRYQLVPVNQQTRFALPIWCYRSPRGIYHDFRGDYLVADLLDYLTKAHPGGFTFDDALEQGITRNQVISWYQDGYLFPVKNTHQSVSRSLDFMVTKP